MPIARRRRRRRHRRPGRGARPGAGGPSRSPCWSGAPHRAARCAGCRPAGPLDAGPDRVHHALGVRGDLRRCRRDARRARHAAPADILARHAWGRTRRLDLFADLDRTADAIGRFAGAGEARGFRAFTARAQRIYDTLERPFIRGALPDARSRWCARRHPRHAADQPVRHAVAALGTAFRRPAAAPAVRPLRHLLRLLALSGAGHADAGGACGAARASGWWRAACTAWPRRWPGWRGARRGDPLRRRGGEIAVAGGRATGVRLADGERLPAEAVVLNADPAALAAGCFGAASPAPCRAAAGARSLSALTWAMQAGRRLPADAPQRVLLAATTPPSSTHLRAAALPRQPTVYVCAQDRGGRRRRRRARAPAVLVNAPADGDATPSPHRRSTHARTAVSSYWRDAACMLTGRGASVTTGRRRSTRLFPATGGALYGPAVHGPMATFRRPGSRTAAGPVPGGGQRRIRARGCRWRRCRAGWRRRR